MIYLISAPLELPVGFIYINMDCLQKWNNSLLGV